MSTPPTRVTAQPDQPRGPTGLVIEPHETTDVARFLLRGDISRLHEISSELRRLVIECANFSAHLTGRGWLFSGTHSSWRELVWHYQPSAIKTTSAVDAASDIAVERQSAIHLSIPPDTTEFVDFQPFVVLAGTSWERGHFAPDGLDELLRHLNTVESFRPGGDPSPIPYPYVDELGEIHE